MKTFFSVALAFVLVMALVQATDALAAAPNGKPYNFIVVLADDLGAKELGCYGHTRHRTPHLDRLAAEGTRFETAYATPLCTPTRVLLMTGQYAFRTGYFNLIGRPYTPLPTSSEYDVAARLTFSDVLQAKGYATALAGKWQLTGKVPTLVKDCGFDEYLMWAYEDNLPPGVKHTGAYEGNGNRTARYWHPCLLKNGEYVQTTADDYGPDMFTDYVLDFARRNRERPFCVYFTMPLTHGPHDPTPDLARPGKRTERGFQPNLEYLDHLMGRLTRGIDELKLGEQTLLVFIGDNGTGGDGKGTVTELGARVPLIVRCPGTVKSGVVSRELASAADVFPTLLELAEAKLPQGHVIDGLSLAPTLRGNQKKHREWLFSYLSTGRILRDQRWLLEVDGKSERFFDCGESRDGSGYRNVTASKDAEVVAARQRFEEILKGLPGPDDHPGLRLPAAAEEATKPKNRAARRRAKADR